MAIAVPVKNRRRQQRHKPRPGSEATLAFRFPDRESPVYAAEIRDVSVSGLSIVVGRPFPAVEIGDVLREAIATLCGRTIRGEFLVMHVTPKIENGATCGGLFYPETDADILAMRDSCRELEAAVTA